MLINVERSARQEYAEFWVHGEECLPKKFKMREGEEVDDSLPKPHINHPFPMVHTLLMRAREVAEAWERYQSAPSGVKFNVALELDTAIEHLAAAHHPTHCWCGNSLPCNEPGAETLEVRGDK
jgi:hypothetical protein